MVNNFTIVSIDVSGVESATKLLKAYGQAVSSTKFTGKQRDDRQKILERYIGRKLSPGTRLVRGQVGGKESADYLVPTSSKIIQTLYKNYAKYNPKLQAIASDYAAGKSFDDIAREYGIRANQIPGILDQYGRPVKSVELKASSRQASTIGQSTIKDRAAIYTPGSHEVFSDADIKRNILGPSAYRTVKGQKVIKKGYLIDLDKNFPKSGDPTDYVFNTWFKKDPKLKKIFYEKASTILLGNTYEIDGKSGTRLIGIAIPEKLFTAHFFKAHVLSKAIVISVNTTFQNSIIKEINAAYLDEKKKEKGYKQKFTTGGKEYTIDYLPAIEGTEFFGMEITNSIKVRPIDTFILRAEVEQQEKQTIQQPQKPVAQKFISAAQWTVLVKKRLGTTMGTFGPPEQPWLKERSGRFRDSINIMVNYRSQAIQYTYNPLYSALEQYGYTPGLQIEGAIRDVAKMFYAKAFNIFEKSN